MAQQLIVPYDIAKDLVKLASQLASNQILTVDLHDIMLALLLESLSKMQQTQSFGTKPRGHKSAFLRLP